MRVCLVSTEFAPFHGWGVGTYASQAARAFAGAGHEVHVLTDDSPRLRAEARLIAPGVRFHVIERRAGAAGLEHVPCRATRGALAIHTTLARLHGAHRFEYVEFADFYGPGFFAVEARRTTGLFHDAVLGVRLHSPIFVLREVNGQDQLNLNTACVEHMEAEALRGADVVLSPSRAMLDKAGPRLGGASQPGRAVVPYPFDAASLAELGPREPPAVVEGGVPEVLFYGRLEFRKGIQVLIDAACRLLDEGVPLRVRIVGVDTPTAPGGGSLLGWLRGRVGGRWVDRFTFEGNRPRGRLGPLLSGAAAVCVPSLWENFPNVCLESMAFGKAVVGSDAGGIPEIIEDGRSGVLFRSGSAESLAGVLRRVLGDGSLRDRLGGAAPGRVAALCDPGSVVERTIAVVREAQDRSATRVLTRGAGPPGGAPGPRVSVLIPFFNLAAYLPAAIESVRAQTFRDLEVIVIDDGSTEAASRSLIASLESGGGPGRPPLRVIRQPNRGLSAARNAGLCASSAPWVVPLDADDMLSPTFVERAVSCAEADPGVALVTSWMSCFEESAGAPTLAFVPVGFDRDMLCVANVASSCTALLDRARVLDAGGYDETLEAFEDWDLYCTLAERGERASVIPEFLIVNRIRAGSMLRSLSESARFALHARVRAKHPNLASDPARVERMLAWRPTPASPAGPGIVAGRLRGLLRRVIGGG
jgi:glycosyltransferase involved in cell wall biosynthesis